MITLRPSKARGHFDFGWLDTHHSFSFGEYYDPAHQQFRALRVINEDQVQPGQGFGMHGHQDMEILTWILSGALEHQDSMGNRGVIRPGEAQRMSAGTGVRHSEFNPSSETPVHLLQIWLLPEARDLPPSYEQKAFAEEALRNKLQPIASPDGRENSVSWHQGAVLSAGRFDAEQQLSLTPSADRHLWMQVAKGSLSLNKDQILKQGDGAALSHEPSLVLRFLQDSEILVFDLA
jgi:quercetin 2,3-dioxygenase